MNISDFFKNAKKNKSQLDENKELIQQESDGQNNVSLKEGEKYYPPEEDNILKKAEKPKVTTINKKWLFIFGGFIISFLIGTLLFSLLFADDRGTKKKANEEKLTVNQTVKGEHLNKMPDNYSQSNQIKLKPKENENDKKDYHDKQQYQGEMVPRRNNYYVPVPPTRTPSVPTPIVPPSYQQQGLSEEEKSFLKKQEQIQKANESPIKFNISLD